jgi:hypothetical protein
MMTNALDEKKRRFFVFLAVALLASTVGLGFLVVPHYIQSVKPSHVRFDETSQGQFYAQILVDTHDPIDDLLVVHSKEFNDDISITVYTVLDTVDVLSIIKATGIGYDMFSYSVYGIVYQDVNIMDKVNYRFLFQASMYNTDSWYLTGEVTPTRDYIENGIPIHQINDGMTVIEIIDGLNDFLNVPFT